MPLYIIHKKIPHSTCPPPCSLSCSIFFPTLFTFKVIQRRANGETDFYKGWNGYAEGFGDVTCEHWIGKQPCTHVALKEQPSDKCLPSHYMPSHISVHSPHIAAQ